MSTAIPFGDANSRHPGPTNVDQTSAPSDENLDTNSALLPDGPGNVGSYTPDVVGKFTEPVMPLTYTFPKGSRVETEMLSELDPPKYDAYIQLALRVWAELSGEHMAANTIARVQR